MSQGERTPTLAAIDYGKQQGFTIVQGDPYHLNLDLDNTADINYYETVALPTLQKHLRIREVDRWKSKSGNLHVLLKVDFPLSVSHRIAIQACLGSDRQREMHGIVKVIADSSEEPSILFKPAEPASTKDDDIPF